MVTALVGWIWRVERDDRLGGDSKNPEGIFGHQRKKRI